MNADAQKFQAAVHALDLIPAGDDGIDELIRQLQLHRANGRTKVRVGLPGELNTAVSIRADLESDVTGELDTVYLYNR